MRQIKMNKITHANYIWFLVYKLKILSNYIQYNNYNIPTLYKITDIYNSDLNNIAIKYAINKNK